MKSDNYWRIFIESGSPNAYLEYKKLKRLEAMLSEERSKNSEEFSTFEEFENAEDRRRDSD